MIDTSGMLIIGASDAMPPSLPRLVIVIVEPVSSSRGDLLLRAASGCAADLGGEIVRARGFRVACPSGTSTLRRLRRDADVHGLVLDQHHALSYSALHCGNLSSVRERGDDERQERQRRGRGPAIVQVLAQRFEARRSYSSTYEYCGMLFADSVRRSAITRQADDLHFFGARARLPRGIGARVHRRGRARGAGLQR